MLTPTLLLLSLLPLLSSPTLVPYSSHHHLCLTDRTIDCYFMIFSFPLSHHSPSTLSLLTSLSSLYSNSFQIAHLNSTHPSYPTICSLLSVPLTQPTLSYYISAFTPLILRYYDQFDLSSLTHFAASLINSRIATLRSQNPPLSQPQTIKLVGTTFNYYIAESNTSTVVIFYHHEELRSRFFVPKFERLGERWKGREGRVRFGTFDVATNQLVQGNSFEELPQILYFQKGTVEPVGYEGRMEVGRVEKWVEEMVQGEGRGEEGWGEVEEESREEGIEERRE